MRIATILVLSIMFFTVATYAQKRPGKVMQWKVAAELPAVNGQALAPGVAGPVAGMHNDKLIIGGGANFPDRMPWLGGSKKYYDDLYVFDKKRNGLLLRPVNAKLPAPLAYSANCTTPKGIVVAGGENENGISNRVFLLQWSEKDERVITRPLPDLPLAVTNAAIVPVSSKVYLAGGETGEGVSDQFLVLDLDDTAKNWKQLPPVPRSLSHTVLLAQSNGNGKAIYAAGGRKKNGNGISELYTSLFEYNLQRNEWAEKQSLPYALSAGSGVAAGVDQLLLLGGDKGHTFHRTEQLIAAIREETDAVKKDSLNREKISLQSSHPGFSNEILMYDVANDEWKMAGHIPYEVPVTTTAVRWNGSVIIPGGEIRAGVRTPKILTALLPAEKDK